MQTLQLQATSQPFTDTNTLIIMFGFGKFPLPNYSVDCPGLVADSGLLS